MDFQWLGSAEVGKEALCNFGREKEVNGQPMNCLSGHKYRGQLPSNQGTVPYDCGLRFCVNWGWGLDCRRSFFARADADRFLNWEDKDLSITNFSGRSRLLYSVYDLIHTLFSNDDFEF